MRRNGQTTCVPRLRRLTVSLKHQTALTVERVPLDGQKLVYVLVQDKKHSYRDGRSRIVYIGTTKNGWGRVAQSAAAKVDSILGSRGVRRFTARVITCRPRRGVKTWLKLERALLLAFKAAHGEVPVLNTQGRRIKELDEFRYFKRSRLMRILDDLA